MTSTPLKADLLAAQRVWVRLLTSVITDGRIRRIDGDDGEPVAYLVPIKEYKRMNGVYQPRNEISDRFTPR